MKFTLTNMYRIGIWTTEEGQWYLAEDIADLQNAIKLFKNSVELECFIETRKDLSQIFIEDENGEIIGFCNFKEGKPIPYVTL